MLLGSPNIGRANYVRFKLQKEMHTSWVEMKYSLGLKNNDMLTCHLLNSTMTVLNRRNSTKVQMIYTNQSELFHLSSLIGI